MWTAIGIIVAYCFLFGVVIWLARREGKKSAKLEELRKTVKRQAEEQYRANKSLDSVRNMDEHTVRNKLHSIANSINKK